MIYSSEVKNMCPVTQGAHHGCAPIPEEGKWVYSREIKDISGYTHGIGWCAPQQGTCKLSLNVKEGIIEEALIETVGCSGMTHSAAMAAEALSGKTILEALNTDLVCDAINTAMRELFLQIVYGRTQSAFSENGLVIGAEGYITRNALDENNEIIGYEFVNLGRVMEMVKDGMDANEAIKKATGTYGRFADAAKYIDPRKE